MELGTFGQVVRVVNTLSARQNLLPTHEHVVRIRIFWIIGVGHCVERSNGQRIFVQHVKVSVVFCLDQFSEQLLVGSRQIILIAHLNAGISQDFNGIRELKLEWWLQELESLDIVLLTNGSDFLGVIVAQSLEHGGESVANGENDLMVMIFEGHLQIQANKFS